LVAKTEHLEQNEWQSHRMMIMSDDQPIEVMLLPSVFRWLFPDGTSASGRQDELTVVTCLVRAGAKTCG
jgi:hypothetical protein